MDFFDDWWSRTKGGAVLLYNNLKELANPILTTAMVPIDSFKSAAAEWLAQYNELLAIPDSELPPDLILDKKNLVLRGQSIIDKTKALGLGVDMVTGQMNGLFIPVIIAGTVVAVSGMMMYWQNDYIKFQDTFAGYKAMRSSGASHDDAMDVMTGRQTKSAFGDAEKIIKYALFAGAGYYAYKLAVKYRLLK